MDLHAFNILKGSENAEKNSHNVIPDNTYNLVRNNRAGIHGLITTINSKKEKKSCRRHRSAKMEKQEFHLNANQLLLPPISNKAEYVHFVDFYYSKIHNKNTR